MAPSYVPRLLRIPKQSFFLFGPRGSGKSTWVRTELPEAQRIDLLDEGRFQGYLAEPGRFADELRAVRPGGVVCVDEIQRIPSLLNEVHRFIEERRLRFVLCGSSARKLKQHGTNLLAGRALRRDLHPFVPRELGKAFELERALAFGTLPVIWQSDEPRAALTAYVQMYLREEIQAEALVRSLPGFVRFLPVAAIFHAQVLSVASLARDAGVARTTISGYLEILEDTLLAFRLPAWEGGLRVREKRHPKLYWVDAGLARAARRQLGGVIREERGPLFEGWVVNLIRIHADYGELFDDWYYWAPGEARETEVDLLLRRGREWLAMEIKSSERIGPAELRGLRAIADLRGLKRRVLVQPGGRPRVSEDGIEIWPVTRLLEALADDRLWP